MEQQNSQLSQLLENANHLFDIGASVTDCGIEPLVSRHDLLESQTSHALFDFSDCLPTKDQQEINLWLSGQNIDGRAILHMGAGNSSVASQSEAAASVLAVTVAANEKHHGDSLSLDNYEVLFENKHNAAFAAFIADKKFDYILDNNLSSFVCCQQHFLAYIAALVNALADDGVLVTHWLGMQWVLDLGIDDTGSCWILDEAKLNHVAASFNLSVSRQGNLFFLSKNDNADIK
jgi:hypothetical protein